VHASARGRAVCPRGSGAVGHNANANAHGCAAYARELHTRADESATVAPLPAPSLQLRAVRDVRAVHHVRRGAGAAAPAPRRVRLRQRTLRRVRLGALCARRRRGALRRVRTAAARLRPVRATQPTR
jgi:hypothetical protein